MLKIKHVSSFKTMWKFLRLKSDRQKYIVKSESILFRPLMHPHVFWSRLNYGICTVCIISQKGNNPIKTYSPFPPIIYTVHVSKVFNVTLYISHSVLMALPSISTFTISKNILNVVIITIKENTKVQMGSASFHSGWKYRKNTHKHSTSYITADWFVAQEVSHQTVE